MHMLNGCGLTRKERGRNKFGVTPSTKENQGMSVEMDWAGTWVISLWNEVQK